MMVRILLIALLFILGFQGKANAQCKNFIQYQKAYWYGEEALKILKDSIFIGFVKVEDIQYKPEFVASNSGPNVYEITIKPLYSFLSQELKTNEKIVLQVPEMLCDHTMQKGKIYQRIFYQSGEIGSNRDVIRSLDRFSSKFLNTSKLNENLIKNLSEIQSACENLGGKWFENSNSDKYKENFRGCNFSGKNAVQAIAKDHGKICYDTFECEGGCLDNLEDKQIEKQTLEKIYEANKDYYETSYKNALERSKKSTCYKFAFEERSMEPCEVKKTAKPDKSRKEKFIEDNRLGQCSKFNIVDQCQENVISFGRIYKLEEYKKVRLCGDN